jgi:hypothetical protein
VQPLKLRVQSELHANVPPGSRQKSPHVHTSVSQNVLSNLLPSQSSPSSRTPLPHSDDDDVAVGAGVALAPGVALTPDVALAPGVALADVPGLALLLLLLVEVGVAVASGVGVTLGVTVAVGRLARAPSHSKSEKRSSAGKQRRCAPPSFRRHESARSVGGHAVV